VAGRVSILAVTGLRPVEPGQAELRAGVVGRIAPDVSEAEFVGAVRTVATGEPYLSLATTRWRPVGVAEVRAPVPEVPLSPRERQVLALIAQGLTHHQIARRMDIAKATVDTYVERIRAKLRLGNKAELTIAAVNLAVPAMPFAG
jgi:DNA-binding NarL/FixJ family response regulator